MHIMLDIETMGTRPDSAILSIGACLFDTPPSSAQTPSFEGAEDFLSLPPETRTSPWYFYQAIDLQSCLDMGMSATGSTWSWWMRQSELAKNAVMHNTQPIALVLQHFGAWVATARERGNLRVWGHGATFDPVIVAEAYASHHVKCPFDYYEVRDTRTVFDLAEPRAKYWDRAFGNPHPHHALYDAVAQARKVAHCYSGITVE